MKKQNLFLIFAILLTSCAPGQPPATPTFAPTATPVPSATATLIPTVTSTPTEVPIPEHEYQVTDASGNTILVVDDKLYKWENSKLVPVEMENTSFENAIDASNAAMALAPAEYFEGDQQALKDILFPPGVKVHTNLEQFAFKSGSLQNSGIISLPIYGLGLGLTRVRSYPQDNFELLVFNLAIMGVDQPVPVIVGKVENGQYFFYKGYANYLKLTNDPLYITPQTRMKGFTSPDFFNDVLGKPVMMDLVLNYEPTKYKPHPKIPQEIVAFRKLMYRRMNLLNEKVLVELGKYDGPPLVANSEVINFILNRHQGFDFDGFMMDGYFDIFDNQ